MTAKSITLEIRLKLQGKLFELGDYNGPVASHPMRHLPMAHTLLKLKDEAEIAKQENLMVRQVGLAKLLKHDETKLQESLKNIGISIPN